MLRGSFCSEPQCATPLTEDMKVCPTCAGSVSGVIDHPKKRLAAEEEWEESEKQRLYKEKLDASPGQRFAETTQACTDDTGESTTASPG